jgi:hypothetical protein
MNDERHERRSDALPIHMHHRCDLEVSRQHCTRLGAKKPCPAGEMGEGIMAVIEDPAGAVTALFQLK